MKSNASIQSIAAAHFPATKAIVPIYKIIMSGNSRSIWCLTKGFDFY